MAASLGNAQGEGTNLSLYANDLWNRIRSNFPVMNSGFFAKISNLYLRISPARSQRRKPSIPLPLPSNLIDSKSVPAESREVFELLEDILEQILSNLHHIQKSLCFWQSRAEGTNAQKVYFMVFERGPRAFIDGTIQLIRGCAGEGPCLQHLGYYAAARINEKIVVLTRLQHCLAAFLAQIYMEVDKFGETLIKEPDQTLPSLLVTINGFFSKLEESNDLQPKNHKRDYSILEDGSYGNTVILLFEKLPVALQEKSQWTVFEIRDVIKLIYQNLRRLDSWLSFLVTRCQKPRRMTLFWLRYTCGAVGLSVCSIWLLRHSSLMGSSDIDNWINEAKESTIGFWKDHVEMPLLSIRDELFETFRRRQKGVIAPEDVQLTANSLHKMLLAFTEQTKGQKLSQNATDQEMMEIVMSRYEKELLHPIQNLLGGELANALLIQIQKLKLDLETALLELDQILRANQINFAVLAALPAFFVFIILLMLVRAWFMLDKGAEGRGRIARIQRRLLVVEVEEMIMQFQTCMDGGLDEYAQSTFGLELYSLDRLYKAVERHAKETGEWTRLRQDIIHLGKPGVSTAYKLRITSRMERVYECLLPSSKRI